MPGRPGYDSRAAAGRRGYGAEFTETVKPFLNSTAQAVTVARKRLRNWICVSTPSAESVVQDFQRWDRLREKLAARQMPPKQAKAAPTSRARQQVINWIDATWKSEARRNDGDPGRRARAPSQQRRIQLHHPRSDGRRYSSGAGVPGRSGESRGLRQLRRVVDDVSRAAARNICRRRGKWPITCTSTPDGFEFAPHPMLVETDREKFCIQQIVDFYDRQPTDYAEYFRAAWLFKHRAVFGKSQGDARRHRGRKQGERQISHDDLGGSREEGRRRPARQTSGDVARAARSQGRISPSSRAKARSRCATSS